MSQEIGFKRNMGLFMAVMIGIGATMGPGVFALPGELAEMIGPIGILVYLAMGLLTVFTALNYAELGAAIPLAGGGYSFTSRTLSRPVAFFTGWFFWIGNTLACSMYALIFAMTVRAYFWPNASIALIALATTIVFTIVNLWGMSQAILIITVMNLVELAILIGVAAFGIVDIEAATYTPIAPMGWRPFAPAMALIYISYVGFELITNASEEIIEPGKNVPRAILITLAVSTAIYVFVVGVMFGTVPSSELAHSEIPFIFTAERLFGPWGRWAGIIGTVMASLSAFSVTLGASARILYALGRDRHLPRFFGQLHHRFRTPHISLIICALIVVAFSSSGIIRFVASISDFGYLMALGITNYAVISLRKKMPNLRRPFSSRFFPVVPILGVITTWAFVPALEPRSFLLGGLLTIVGWGIYMISPANRAELREIPGKIWHGTRLYIERLRRRRMRVLIISGKLQGQNIATRLLATDEVHMMYREAEHQITFIEEDEALCADLERRFAVPIYKGDGTKKELLEQVGLENIDVVIAASDDDGRNVISALQARQLGLPKVIAIVQDPEYTQLLEENNVVAISAPWATAEMVVNHIDRPGLVQLMEIGNTAASMMDVTVREGARVKDQAIRDIPIPKDCLIAAIIRDNEYVVPKGGATIQPGDRLIFIGPPAAVRRGRDVFMKSM